MIYDKMENLGFYRGISRELDQLIDCLTNGEMWKRMPEGRTSLDGDRIFITHSTVDLIPYPTLYERHHQYADLQIVLAGGETMYRCPVDELSWEDDGKETQFAKGPDGTALQVQPGEFVIFFPTDAHMPIRGKGRCEKLVGKFVCPMELKK